MPELPEVETVMRGLMPVMVGNKITKVTPRRKDLRIPFPANLKKNLENCSIKNMRRRAKFILITMDEGKILVIHLGMSGRLSIIQQDESYNPSKHDHLIIGLQSGIQIVYNDPRRFGMIFTTSEQEWEKHPAFAGLGPEPLGNEFSAQTLYNRLKNKKTPIKQALLDQHVVVGVGNIYASEALHLAGISPLKPSNKINLHQMENLTKAIRTVLNKAIKAGGSTLKDYRHADGQLGYFQHNFSVYGREKLSCLKCDCDITKTGGIQKITQSGRSTYYCKKKQK